MRLAVIKVDDRACLQLGLWVTKVSIASWKRHVQSGGHHKEQADHDDADAASYCKYDHLPLPCVLPL